MPSPCRVAGVLALVFSLAGHTFAQDSTTEPSAESYDVHITDTTIPMRDGTELHARIWRPVDADAVPAIVSLTPYTADDAHDRGRFFAEHGYVYVNVDVRGRGGSEGTFWPFARDGEDGHDAVQWVARQSWCDGRVGMRGGSYRGTVQWQTLAEQPDALKTIVPTAAAYPGWDFPNPNGIFLSYAARWIGFTRGQASQGALFGDTDYWNEKYLRLYREHRPFAALDSLTGLSGRIFDRWTRHPRLDSYWTEMTPSAAAYDRFDIPILTITGHFDGDQEGALRYYQRHMRHGPDTGRHYLLMGPWTHGDTRDPSREVNGLTFGPNSVVDIEELHLDWFNFVFYDQEKPEALQDRVTYYAMGPDEWRSASRLDAATDSMTWHLASPGIEARDVLRSGRLQPAPPSAGDVDSMTHDPRTTPVDSAALASDNSFLGPGLAFSDTWTGGPRLVYHSPPLAEAVTVAGVPRLDAYIELDVPDTDLLAAIYEIRPDGTTIYLGESALRARHREGVDEVVFPEPGTAHRYTFDRFNWFARELQDGSRLRLVLTPLNTPLRDKNYNGGGNTIEASNADAQTATIKLHLSPEHPSALSVPVRR
jgi:putative CocE/NonD family hydrolase